MAYNEFRNEFSEKLITQMGALSIDHMNQILAILDTVAKDYTMQRITTALTLLRGDVPELVKIYIAAKKVEGLSEQGLKNSLARLRIMCDKICKPLTEITSTDIRVFLYNYQQERGVSNASLNSVRIQISSFFHWLAAEGYIPKDPALTVKPIKYEQKQRESLTQLELEFIRKACKDIREKAIVEFFYSTGCRVSEMADIKIADINFRTDEVTLYGKGKKYRTSYLNAKAHVALNEYLDSRKDDSPYLFVSIRKPHKKLQKEAIESIIRSIRDRTPELHKALTPHIFRHTTATQAVSNGMPVDEVQKLLGHTNIATTMIYVETADESVKTSHQKAVI